MAIGEYNAKEAATTTDVLMYAVHGAISLIVALAATAFGGWIVVGLSSIVPMNDLLIVAVIFCISFLLAWRVFARM